MVEVDAVGEVEVGLDVDGAGEVHVLIQDGDVPRVDVQVPVLRVSRPIRLSELEPLDGFCDEAVELRDTDLSRDSRDLVVDPPGRLTRQRRNRVDRRFRDGPGTPRRNRADVDLTPQPGEAVAELEGVPDQLLR
ncbi:hypothetical protein [Nocardioides exalbidus]|uniref:hypothetical protein n=1 Tax=Nocardioides exalbidus TaxID=402596 RepID=UPI000B82868F|nr:hypothetical protein [Nocardioides exalbidus]